MEILLIEDDLEDAGLTIEALRTSDVPCRISLVRDGEEAMEFLLRHERFRRAPQPDLILLDLNLPKKSGREVLAEVRRGPASGLRAGGRADQFGHPPGNSPGRKPARRKRPHQAGRFGAVRHRRQVAEEVHAFRRDPAAVVFRCGKVLDLRRVGMAHLFPRSSDIIMVGHAHPTWLSAFSGPLVRVIPIIRDDAAALTGAEIPIPGRPAPREGVADLFFGSLWTGNISTSRFPAIGTRR